MLKKGSGVVLTVLLVAACATTPAPIEDYTLARTALDSARIVEAARYSPGYWHQAEEAYRRAEILFNEREYPEAKKEFVKARLAAEKAENSARLIRQKNGEVL